MKKDFRKGCSDGIPIGLGYFSVAFGFGILAMSSKISVFFAWLISATNLTSAGQVAGVEIIAASGTLAEMALTQLVINLRYSLMGFSLTQKLDENFTTPKRLLLASGITDEIYAVAISQKGKITASYMTGLIVIPFIGWTSGTVAGALTNQLLPDIISNNMGILLYGMFIAVFIPAARKSKAVLLAVITAAAVSIFLKCFLPFVSSGFSVIISAVIAAVICAALFPVSEEKVI
ncbi:MAG: AzlC family ABC transporter permease [Clostridia bacterium]|nr:AzlC family ABC transporter permease [Clostridia bacterium]